MDIEEVYAEDGVPFRVKYIKYIKEHFSDVLGSDIMMLEQPGGLEAIGEKYFGKMMEKSNLRQEERDIRVA